MKAASLPALDGVARTALWTVYGRAAGAAKFGLEDPHAARICADLGQEALRRAFGRPVRSFAARARDFDQRLQPFLDAFPRAPVVSLGEGLETQAQRIRGYGRWTSVDTPEVLALRARWLPPTSREHHHPGDVTAGTWEAELGSSGPAVVIAQGLAMYLPAREVAQLMRRLSARGDVLVVFDVVPPWVSRLSRLRPPVARGLRVPPMPWGVAKGDVRALLSRWLSVPPATLDLETWSLPMPSGPLPGRYTTAGVRLRL
ncbi:MAG: class I SAM-dependent methyltransferase [Myxococcota bacterium]